MTQLTEDQTTNAIRNAATAFEFTEGPLLTYISSVLDIPVDKIYNTKKVRYMADIKFKLNDRNYAVKLKLCNLNKDNLSNTLVLPGDRSNPVIQQILQYMGSFVYIIKTLTYQTIATAEYTSERVKKELAGTYIKFDEETSTFRIIYSIDDSPMGNPAGPVLGFTIISL